MKNILLLTSTISPSPGVHALRHTDSTKRLADYEAALRFYLSLVRDGTVDKIVFVDNSGHTLSSLEQQVNQAKLSEKVEFCSYTSDVPVNNNRLYLELHLIDHFLDNSRCMQDPGAEEFVIWKTTGRYIIKNAARIISSSTQKNDFHLNMRNYPYHVLDFYFFGFRPKAYREIISKSINDLSGLDDGEIRLRRIMDNYCKNGGNVTKRFRHTPRIIGIRGYDGAVYGGLKDFIKYQIRCAANIFTPNIWI